ncbi:MAG: 2-C-methyl-D-erythritol 4-phosphate cytidylyltransferase [Pyrinomonadaceae bacterium]
MTAIAIIVAAGSGKRFGAEKPKQFLELAGTPIIFHTLQRFEACSAIAQIIVVLPAAETDGFLAKAAKYGLQKLKTVVAGGNTRTASVWNGLNAVEPNSAEIIAVHDGARPFVTSEEIKRTIEKARETGAACLVAPVTDTIKEITPDGMILQTIDRNTLRRALTPQCFRIEILRRAFRKIDLLNEQATDESFLVEKLGYQISIVEGSPRNIKITVPEDLILAESLLKLPASRNSKF